MPKQSLYRVCHATGNLPDVYLTRRRDAEKMVRDSNGDCEWGGEVYNPAAECSRLAEEVCKVELDRDMILRILGELFQCCDAGLLATPEGQEARHIIEARLPHLVPYIG